MNVWVNDRTFHELGNEWDPFVGTQDGSYDMTIPRRPVRQKVKGFRRLRRCGAALTFSFQGLEHFVILRRQKRDIEDKSHVTGWR